MSKEGNNGASASASVRTSEAELSMPAPGRPAGWPGTARRGAESGMALSDGACRAGGGPVNCARSSQDPAEDRVTTTRDGRERTAVSLGLSPPPVVSGGRRRIARTTELETSPSVQGNSPRRIRTLLQLSEASHPQVLDLGRIGPDEAERQRDVDGEQDRSPHPPGRRLRYSERGFRPRDDREARRARGSCNAWSYHECMQMNCVSVLNSGHADDFARLGDGPDSQAGS